MNGNVFIDTNVAIYLLAGNEQIINLLDQQTVCLSFIAELELLSKPDINIVEESTIKLFLSQCVTLDFFTSLRDVIIDFRRKYRLKLPDAIIATTAFSLKIPLITTDKGFERITELSLIRVDL